MARMSTDPVFEDLPDDLLPRAPRDNGGGSKGAAVRKTAGPAQIAAARKRAAREAAEQQKLADTAKAARLAQMVNLHLAGYTLEQIGLETGHSVAEMDRIFATDVQRYVRTQPALRTYVRNWVSGKYTELLDTVWEAATDKTHKDMLDAQTAAVRIIERMAKLHGAEAPVQHDVQIEAAPDAVERLVAALAAGQGQGYDMSVFDTVPGEVVHQAVDEAAGVLDVSGNAADSDQPGDEAL